METNGPPRNWRSATLTRTPPTCLPSRQRLPTGDGPILAPLTAGPDQPLRATRDYAFCSRTAAPFANLFV
eukprot:9851885-Lingulodinium_polyedra.AAC.1